jgi:hypothetical protein
MKIPTSPKKNKRKEKVPKPVMESLKHINFHSFLKLNGDVHSLIFPLNGPMKGKGGNQALAHPIVDQYLKKQEEEAPKMEKSSKEFLACVDAFRVFVVQQGEITTQN